MPTKFIGVLSMCDAYLSPAQFDVFVTSELSETQTECVQKVWRMVIDDVIGDMEIFVHELVAHLPWNIREKFILEDDEDDEEEQYIMDPEGLKSIEFTIEELSIVLEAAFAEDKNYKLSITVVSM